MFIIDTDVMIDIQRGYPPAEAWFSGITELPMLPGFVVMELIQAAKNSKQIKDIFELVKPFQIVWPSEQDCQRALIDFSKYNLSHNLGLIDAIIGSMAIGRSASLFTFNIKHYRAIPSLNLIKPYEKQ